MRIDTKMPAANAVAVSSTSTFKLPIGRRYHSLQLLASGTAFAPSDISEIRVLVNEKVIQRFTGADRDTMNQFEGREAAAISAAAFNLVIPFDRYGLLTKDGEEYTALNTGSVDPATGKAITSLSLEVDIGAGPTGTLALQLYATQSEQLPGGAGAIPYIHKASTDFTGADNYDIPDMPRGGVSTAFLDKLFLMPSTSTLENLIVEANNYKLFERTAALNERLQRDGVRVPQNGVYVIDRTEHGYAGDPFDLRGLSDFRLRFTTGAALTLKRYAHYIGGLAD
jgi:hypothetical protein